MSFNRTIVELKRRQFCPCHCGRFSFNRTIVELKLNDYRWHVWGFSSFNRTIVELKQIASYCYRLRLVLF